MATATKATPTKLRNGTWGATAQGTVRKGDTLEITTKAGKTWTARVSAVVWAGKGVSICATESTTQRSERPIDCRKYGWDGVHGSSSYYTSGQYDEDS